MVNLTYRYEEALTYMGAERLKDHSKESRTFKVRAVLGLFCRGSDAVYTCWYDSITLQVDRA